MPPSVKNLSGERQGKKLTVPLLLLLFWLILSLPSPLFTNRGLSSLLQHLLVGVPLVFLVTRLTNYSGIAETKSNRPPNILRLITYSFYLVGQIIIAGIDVVRRVMRPNLDISPGIIKFRTPLKDDISIAINANSITLTPGTITIDVEQDEQGSTFWVHCISQESLADIRKNKGFVDKILNIYR